MQKLDTHLKKPFAIEALFKKLALSEITTQDWQKLEVSLLYNMPNFKTKWDAIRAIYRFLKLRYDEKVAMNISYQFAKYSKLIFQKYENFWGLSVSGLALFEELANFEKYHTEKPRVTLDLFEEVRA